MPTRRISPSYFGVRMRMDAEQFYRTWAPPDALWSDWVAPALFVQIECGDVESDLGEADVSCLPERLPERAAVVLDLPGAEAVRLGVHLATTAGYRPVPLINASPGPLQDASEVCVVDMTELVH